jgi:ATP-dependent helicase/nuclease subunit A
MDEAAIRTLLNLEASVAEDIAATARRMLAQPELAPAFDPGRYLRAHNELEFLDPEGHTARMDRLVEFEQEVWVLDYKSGGLDEAPPRLRAEIHAEQMARYRSAAQALFPAKAVRTVLVFGDGQALWL